MGDPSDEHRHRRIFNFDHPGTGFTQYLTRKRRGNTVAQFDNHETGKRTGSEAFLLRRLRHFDLLFEWFVLPKLCHEFIHPIAENEAGIRESSAKSIQSMVVRPRSSSHCVGKSRENVRAPRYLFPRRSRRSSGASPRSNQNTCRRLERAPLWDT